MDGLFPRRRSGELPEACLLRLCAPPPGWIGDWRCPVIACDRPVFKVAIASTFAEDRAKAVDQPERTLEDFLAS